MPGGWRHVSNDETRKLLAELARELSPKHSLAGVELEVLARSEANDDVLFRRVDDPERVTVVHLTWRGAIEGDPRWPSVVFDGSFDDFVEAICAAETPT